MFNWIIRWSLRNRLLVVIAYIVVLIAGVFVLRRMTLDVLPEFAPPQVVIQTESPGLSPEDVETLITFRIETAVNGTPGVDVVRSKSSAGLSTVIVVFNWGTNIYAARQLVNERLQEVKEQFPPGTQAPVMLPITSAVSWLVKFSLQSDKVPLLDLRTLCDWEIRNRILSISGVASVVCMGPGPKQYQVLLSSPKLLQYNVTVKEIVEALRETNKNVPGGFNVVPGQEFVVTGVGRIRSLEELKKTVVAEREGIPIPLEQVAEVKFGPEFPRGDSAYMGKPAIIGTVSKLFGGDTLTVTYNVEKALEEIRKTLPQGVQLETQVFRQANFIESSVTNLRSALIEGAIVVTIVPVFFLFNVRASFITLTAMPLSLLMGMLVMRAFGVGINAMTLGGLAIAIGAVVDDAIIDVENIFRRLRENQTLAKPRPSFKVVLEASLEVRTAVVYATFIVALVFLPVLALTGLQGSFFAPLALSYILAIMASLGVALTLTPALALIFFGHGSHAADETRLQKWLKQVYHRILNLFARWPRMVMLVVVLICVGALLKLPKLGGELLPEFREGHFVLQIQSVPGTSLAETLRMGHVISEELLANTNIVTVEQQVGRAEQGEDTWEPNRSEFHVELRDGVPGAEQEKLMGEIRDILAGFPGIQSQVVTF